MTTWKRTCIAISLCAMGATLFAAPDDRKLPVLPTDNLPAAIDLAHVPRGLAEPPSPPADNPLTPLSVALGRKLFFDSILSADHSVSCASCHQPEHGFATPDRRAIGIGGRRGPRNAPTLFNRTYGTSMFWDGRVETLEEQALEPIENGFEFAFSVDGVIERLRSDPEYVRAFETAFPGESSVTRMNLGRALASFQRTLLLGDTPVDRFHGGEFAALSDDARQGLWIFESRGGCWRCHSGSNFSDEKFHNTGVAYRSDDPDMGQFMATGIAEHENRFKTPTLRGLTMTAPYMHDGSFATLGEIVKFYNEGGTRNAPGLDERVKPLGLTDVQVGYLVAFLEALSPADESGETAAEESQPEGD